MQNLSILNKAMDDVKTEEGVMNGIILVPSVLFLAHSTCVSQIDNRTNHRNNHQIVGYFL
jgi:hypothetical protein